MVRYEPVRIERLTGDAIARVLGDIARLRIVVFREWPYLYDGSVEYERDYLAEFASARDAVMVAAFSGAEIVGAATASPLEGHSSEFMPLFAKAGIDPDEVFYLGESVLLPELRGRGVGHAFFEHREAHARACQGRHGRYSYAAFCGVVRDANDPRMPATYRPLDGFWRKRGYAPVEGLVGSYDWKEIDAEAETSKPMQFWMRRL
jgi:GNAT superfamily N-acetyltransferase